MITVYNIIQLLLLLLAAPLLLIMAICSPKYRGRVLRRLGYGLQSNFSRRARKQRESSQTVWVHALSVGEVFSAQPLIKSIRSAFPSLTVVFSASTKTGEEQARKHLKNHVDLFLPFPYDLYFCSSYFIHTVRPDLFILVETDFWPNFLYLLKKRNIPALLVNGRISQASFDRYKKISFIFSPLFSSFRYISMQTGADADKMQRLGVAAEKIKSLGNLKYDAAMPSYSRQMRLYHSEKINRKSFGIPSSKTIWVAGSTHAGEEEIILSVYKRLSLLFPDLLLVIAPRQPDRAREIKDLSTAMGLTSRLRTPLRESDDETMASILILDTMGELPQLYGSSNMAFVGGSLVPRGGHNPLEPASFGKPVVFGPYMDDFSEIANDLLQNRAARSCSNGDELFEIMHNWLESKETRLKDGRRGKELVELNQGVTEKHIPIISEFITENGKAINK